MFLKVISIAIISVLIMILGYLFLNAEICFGEDVAPNMRTIGILIMLLTPVLAYLIKS